MEKKKTDARRKGEESCPGPGGKNIQQGTTIERKWGIGTTVSVSGKRIEVGAPKETVS